jgi:dolichol-phosphate mannosyltransferase
MSDASVALSHRPGDKVPDPTRQSLRSLSVIVPTYNEEGNVAELIARIDAATRSYCTEIIVVDDSTDDTRAAVERHGSAATAIVRLIARPQPVGGLSGAVIDGIRAAEGDWIVVLDGDLQHPPELIPTLIDLAVQRRPDMVVASRYRHDGASSGLASPARRATSRAATAAAKILFPLALRHCTDPMTGFFAIRRASIHPEELRPRGFKILLEILIRQRLSFEEVPLRFESRTSGRSKATARQGLSYLSQLLSLRLASRPPAK